MPKRIRHTKSISFALEMVRACLPHTPTGLRLTGMWMEMNMETDGATHRLVNILINIHGAPCNVQALCDIQCNDSGEWFMGQCSINLTDDPTTKWTFHCRLVGDSLEVRMPLDSLHDVDPETISLLKNGGFYWVDDVARLQEFPVCSLLVEDDLGFGMSNELAQRAVDRFERLRSQMEALGLSFAGTRRSPRELYEAF